MNEREAIAFEMQELKEQRRADFEMYFELRKYQTKRYEELQNRLREIDERDLYQPQPKSQPITTLDKLIPKSAGLTPTELAVERAVSKVAEVKSKRKGKTIKVDHEALIEEVEKFLKEQGIYVKLGSIKKAMEDTFGVTWTNFNNTLKQAMDKGSNHIEVTKDGPKKFLYSYKA